MKNRVLPILLLLAAVPVNAATVLVLRFQNASRYPDLSWIGESVRQKLKWDIFASQQLVIDADAEQEAFTKLQLRPGANFTKATLLKLGQQAQADYLCYGTFDITGDVRGDNADPSKLKDSSVQIAAHFLDLRNRREAENFSEAGKLTDLSRLEEHLAWQALNVLEPSVQHPLDQFMNAGKLVRLEAEESYARGMLTTKDSQRAVWLRQANALDPKFSGPIYELGLVATEAKKNGEALAWLGRIPSLDPRYGPARFRMGLAAYRLGDYTRSANYFRELLRLRASPEVYNDLAVAESQSSAPSAVDDFRRALEADGDDPDYRFNLGAALLLKNDFDEAAKLLSQVVQADSDDEDARELLVRAQRREGTNAGAKIVTQLRLKVAADENVLRPQSGPAHP